MTSSSRRHALLGGVGVFVLCIGALRGASRPTAIAYTPILNVVRAGDSAPTLRFAVERAADLLDSSLARLSALLDSSNVANGDNADDQSQLQQAFRASRASYKRMEAVTEFYAPALAAALNSRRQEVDDDDAPPPSTLAPSGFPALELLLWSRYDAARASEARTIIVGMRLIVARIRSIGAALSPSDAQLIELARLEVARVSTLGVAGFDTPLTHEAMAESADALDGLRELFHDVGRERWPDRTIELHTIDSTFARASAYLRANADFIVSDRLTFVVGYATPVARAIDALRVAAHVTAVAMPRGWRADVASVYDSAAFDSRAYASAEAPAATSALIALGQRLFADPALSGNGTRACTSCHNPARAFTDGLTKAQRLDGQGTVARHTPTLINAALSPAQFADERAATLEEQVVRVIENPAEMGSSLDRIVGIVSRNAEYVQAFERAFGASRSPQAENDAVSAVRVRYALAAYVRTLTALNSRFDRAVRGDTLLLGPSERRGFTLFMGKATCGTCHFAPLFNGNTPPLYRTADVEVIGTPISPSRASTLDPDSGRAAIDGLPLHLHAFKTPTVRNSVLTAPYMHNGAFRSLDELLRFYDRGGGVGAGASIPNQTLSSASLHLSSDERADIIAFIGSLTDTSVYATTSRRQTAHR